MTHILIVDDAATDRQLAGKVVKDMGLQATFASNGVEGIEKAKQIKPTLILLDVVMPEKDGFATCRELKKDADTKDIPVILITSKDGETDRFWGKKQGAAAYLTKPYKPQALQQLIESYL